MVQVLQTCLKDYNVMSLLCFYRFPGQGSGGSGGGGSQGGAGGSGGADPLYDDGDDDLYS